VKLRDYQIQCLDSIRSALSTSKTALCVAATGSGKTVIFSQLAHLANQKNNRVLILVQKNILVKQSYDSIKRFTDDVGIYNAGLKKKEIKNITVASIQSLVKATIDYDFEIAVIDEAHRFNLENKNSPINQILNKLNNPYVLGFTATPYSHNDFIYGENKFWDKPVFEIDINYLTEKTYLVPLKFEAPLGDKKIDLSDIKKSKGDFIAKDLSNKIMKNKDLIHKQVEDALNRSADRKFRIWLVTSIEHAEYLYQIVPYSYIIHSKRKDRSEQLDRYKEVGGNLISVLVASEGFDHPPADCLVMMRPTRSHTLYRQAAGRVLRTAPNKKDALFLDYGGIVDAIGSVYQPVDFSKKPKNDLKLCEDCGAYCDKKDVQCSSCGNDFLVMCEFCFSTKKYSKPCENCDNKHKRKIDIFKNLTDRAYMTGYKEVSMVLMSDYKSKGGNDCVKITYYKDMSKILDEYFVKNYKVKELSYRLKQLGVESYRESVKTPIFIKVKKADNGYRQVIDVRR